MDSKYVYKDQEGLFEEKKNFKKSNAIDPLRCTYY